MRAGIEAEDEKRKLQLRDLNKSDSVETEFQDTKRRLEKNQQDFELQQRIAAELLLKNQ